MTVPTPDDTRPTETAETAPRWATVRETSQYLSRTTGSVYADINRGALTAYRIPGRRTIRLDLNEVDRALKADPTFKAGVDSLEDYVRRAIEEAPPLTTEQCDRIAALLARKAG